MANISDWLHLALAAIVSAIGAAVFVWRSMLANRVTMAVMAEKLPRVIETIEDLRRELREVHRELMELRELLGKLRTDVEVLKKTIGQS